MGKVLDILITRGGNDDFVLSVNLEAVAKFFCAPGQTSTVRVLTTSPLSASPSFVCRLCIWFMSWGFIPRGIEPQKNAGRLAGA